MNPISKAHGEILKNKIQEFIEDADERGANQFTPEQSELLAAMFMVATRNELNQLVAEAQQVYEQ